MQVVGIELFRLRLFDRGSGLSQTIQKEMGESEVLIVNTARRVEADGFAGFRQCFVILSKNDSARRRSARPAIAAGPARCHAQCCALRAKA